MERKREEFVKNRRENRPVSHTGIRRNEKKEMKPNIKKEDKREKKPVIKTNKKQLSNNQKEEVGFKKPKLKIIPLGGLQEVGKNITVFEYENDMIIVDCGVYFPDDDMLGGDLVIPDFTY